MALTLAELFTVDLDSANGGPPTWAVVTVAQVTQDANGNASAITSLTGGSAVVLGCPALFQAGDLRANEIFFLLLERFVQAHKTNAPDDSQLLVTKQYVYDEGEQEVEVFYQIRARVNDKRLAKQMARQIDDDFS
jgi:hypothetical protein